MEIRRSFRVEHGKLDLVPRGKKRLKIIWCAKAAETAFLVDTALVIRNFHTMLPGGDAR
jgi:hypothetical protein